MSVVYPGLRLALAARSNFLSGGPQFLPRRRFFAPRLEPLEDRRLLATFTVTNTLDAGAGSLRQAIVDANASLDGGTIEFNIPATDPNHVDVDSALAGGDPQPDVWRIQPLTELPALGNLAAGITIDGRTQTAFGGNLNPLGPEIVLDGNGLNARGVLITTGDHAVLGLNVQRFGRSGIVIAGGDRAVVAGNYVGVDATGTVAAGNGRWGVGLDTGATNNRIGTNGDGVDDAAERNVLSANGFGGVGIVGASNNDNVIAGNYIGTNATGTAAIGNINRGVEINGGAQRNRVGTNADGNHDAAEGNVISGNEWEGLSLSGVGTSHNVVAGNLIGTDPTGTAALGNLLRGVLISSSATFNTIGGSTPAARNIISGNVGGGMRLLGADVSNNRVSGNYIGTDVTGNIALPNLASGILLDSGANNNVIGTNGDGQADAAEANVISGNTTAQGIRLSGAGTSFNVIAGNFVGTNAAGTAAIPNETHGVSIGSGATQNRIGTNGDGIGDAAERNVISGNMNRGVLISDAGTDNNVVAGNYVGVDVTATGTIGNGVDGVRIQIGAKSNRIGTDGNGQGDAAERNIIGGNLAFGVDILSPDTALNVVAGNSIGTDAAGILDLGNFSDGVRIEGSAERTTVGGTGPLGNTIAFNERHGISLSSIALAGNAILGNAIYSNIGLGIDLGADGVTPNDIGDADGGPNQLQNFPEIAAVLIGEALTVAYAVDSTAASSTYPLRIEFFEASSDGQEGQRFLGFDTLVDPGSAKTVVLAGVTGITAGERIIATATDAAGNTSEFSSSVPFELRANPWYNAANPLNVDGNSDAIQISPIDAVLIINRLNAGLGGAVSTEAPLEPPFYDVSGDGFVAPIDAVLVINFLNSQPAAQQAESAAEGEGPTSSLGAAGAVADSTAVRDAYFSALADDLLPPVRRRRQPLGLV